ncbi:hypothetical protein E2C01_013919 [Portunus trituberculatus]|uniref:Uncharacterized protein n=1 Tax=Portunus trituberculatus TaxID=210409 RepID=A0A5B7DHH1_PORTR|nr:hypothetical protein [Portunus trituberculatus]
MMPEWTTLVLACLAAYLIWKAARLPPLPRDDKGGDSFREHLSLIEPRTFSSLSRVQHCIAEPLAGEENA